MPDEFLMGERLYLRALCAEDATGDWAQWFNDPEVCRFNNHHRFPGGAAANLAYLDRLHASRDALALAIVWKDQQRHIGNIALQNIDWINRSAEFAIVLGDKAFWGLGVGREAGALLVRHGLEELNLHRIHCGTSADNQGMRKLALALGMREEGRRRQAIFKHGQYLDVIEFGLIRE